MSSLSSQKRLSEAAQFADEIYQKLRDRENGKRLDEYFQATGLPANLRDAGLLMLDKNGGLGKKVEKYDTDETDKFLSDRYNSELLIQKEETIANIRSSFRSKCWSNEQGDLTEIF